MSTRRDERAYCSLLSTYPDWWVRRHGDVAIDTLREVHAASGRRRPSLVEHVGFAVDGARIRLLGLLRPSVRAPHLAPLAVAGHRFDQTNGADVEVPRSAWEQTRANAAAIRDTDLERVAAVAYVGMMHGGI